MAIQVGRCGRLVAIALVLERLKDRCLRRARTSPAAQRRKQPSGLHSSNGLTGDDIIGKMLERNRLRNEQLQRYSAVRTYVIRNLRGSWRLRQWYALTTRRRQENIQQDLRKGTGDRASPGVRPLDSKRGRDICWPGAPQQCNHGS